MNHIVVFTEAQDEAQHLSRVTGRDVEVAPKNCDCDFSPMCGKCDRGVQYVMVYSFCQHEVHDVDDTECYDNFCAERERVASIVEADPPPIEHAPLKSCFEVNSETEAA